MKKILILFSLLFIVLLTSCSNNKVIKGTLQYGYDYPASILDINVSIELNMETLEYKLHKNTVEYNKETEESDTLIRDNTGTAIVTSCDRCDAPLYYCDGYTVCVMTKYRNEVTIYKDYVGCHGH